MKPFVLGRRCPDDQFKQSLARQMRMISLVADADYIDQLADDYPSLYGLFAVNNALHDQERGVPFIPGENQRDFLGQLNEYNHTPTQALDGLLSVGVEDMAEAHCRQLRDAKAARRAERGKSRKPEGIRNRPRIRPIAHQRSAA